MPMPLEDWQRRLERHFQQLATARSNSGFHLFALEHDLTDSELEEIGAQLRERLALGLRLEPHWLLWVVYATELGYDYDGGEYWRSFEERTPRWSDKASRNQLREWFSRFQLTYQGVKPSGTWAGHFPIIAWPITHAILSKYLQDRNPKKAARVMHAILAMVKIDIKTLQQAYKTKQLKI